ncbi:MAG TPA: hypothetical protein VEA16_16930 [Vicinamibacterales bacterium]|nr:hypothetical protein [Vicinamibacterales bacterium]
MLPNSRYMIYRVLKPETLQRLADAIGAPVLEAARIPDRPGSYYRAWTTTGECYELRKSGPQAMVPVRRSQFDRTEKLAGATA